jgi:hypothetical protein
MSCCVSRIRGRNTFFLAGGWSTIYVQDTKCHIHHHFAFIRSFFRLASVCDDEAHRCDSEFGVSERDRNEWVSQTEPHWWKKKRQNAITAWSLPYSSYIHTSAWSFCVSYMSRLFSLWLAVSPLPAHSERVDVESYSGLYGNTLQGDIVSQSSLVR